MKKSGISVMFTAGAITFTPGWSAYGQASAPRTDNCVTDRVLAGNTSNRIVDLSNQTIGDLANQTIDLTNHCDVEVEWKMCLNRTDWDWNAFKRGYIGPKKTKRLYINDLAPGSNYKYVYNWCNLDACPVDIPDC